MYVEYKTSWEKRAFAVLLAVVFVFVGMPYVGVETSLEAGAADTETSSISSISSGIKTAGTLSGNTDIVSGNGTYTGQYFPGSVTLFDYLSDEELKNNDPASTVSGYYDPYTVLNTAISNDIDSNREKHNGNENITITYTTTTPRFASTDSVYVHLWNSSNSAGNDLTTNYPGILMNYDNGKFVCTVNPTDLGFSPDKLIFNKNDSSIYYDTVELTTPMSVNTTYNFIDETANIIRFGYRTGTDRGNSIWANVYTNSPPSSTNYNEMPKIKIENGNYYYCYTTATFIPTHINFRQYHLHDSGAWSAYNKEITGATLQYGWTYIVDGGGTVRESYPTVVLGSTSNGAQPIYECKYSIPLYFGAFLRDYGNSPDPAKYTQLNKADYQNFTWQANVAQRNSSSTAIQGLVDNVLNSNGQITQNVGSDHVPLPYFDSARNSDLIKSYNVSNFPFYEISVDAQYAKGHDNNIGKARYYQFNKDETNVYYDKITGILAETDVPIYAQTNTVGFFPFNSTWCKVQYKIQTHS